MELNNIVIPEVEDSVKVEFSDKDVWAEVVDFKSLINVIIAFINKLIKFEF